MAYRTDTTSVAPLSRNAQVLKFFLQQAPTGIVITKLQKLAYLADLEARKYLGQPITTFDYYWHDHGPFDGALYTAKSELVDDGYAEEEQREYFGYRERRVIDRGRSASFDFDTYELEVLSFVADTYLETELRKLLPEVVYKTRPMKAVKRRGERLPMEQVNNTGEAELGYDPKAVIEGEAAITRGDYILASDFFDGLRRQADAAGAD